MVRRFTVRRLLLAVGGVALLAMIVAGLGGLWLRGRILASLPPLDGERVVDGIAARITITRDDLGVPTIRGSTRRDVAFATGFVHAQERFFQMDLLRRRSAGELAALFGTAAVDVDRRTRLHRFRRRAEEGYGKAAPRSREMLEAYTTGVNSGLRALRAAPPEYLLLRSGPARWAPEDTYLVVMSMYLVLQGDLWRRESGLGVMRETLPPELVDFLVPGGTEWDAPLVGGPLPDPPLPTADLFDVRDSVPPIVPADGAAVERIPRPALGSNVWAVGAGRTAHGGALLCNDMHLPLQLPNTWYRLSLEWTTQDGPQRVTGISLPGTPAVVAGSNGRVAWGFANSYGDWADLIVLEPDPEEPQRYLTPDGYRSYEHHQERIAVRGEDDVLLDVADTIWGPVIDEDHRGRRRALRWVAHRPSATNLGLLRMEQAETVADAIALAPNVGLPAQNLIVADRQGSVGWTLIGRVPDRPGPPPRAPIPGSADAGWGDWLPPAEYPKAVDPDDPIVWAANNRVVAGAALEITGDGGYDLGARARQIRDGLRSTTGATETTMLALQLDDKALFLERWRTLLLAVLDDRATRGNPRRTELAGLLRTRWSGRAAIDSAAFRWVRAFRRFLADRVFEPITAACRATDESFDYFGVTNQWEGPLWRLVSERPPHLLAPEFGDWDEMLLAAVDATLDYFLQDDPESELDRFTWGERNRVSIRHPLSRAVPILGRWLDLPPRSLPGDANMPRVQSIGFGASERMIVSPGREENGILHMPGGQSGHPFSPFYRSGHDAWAEGDALPLLPGPTTHRLELLPEQPPATPAP